MATDNKNKFLKSLVSGASKTSSGLSSLFKKQPVASSVSSPNSQSNQVALSAGQFQPKVFTPTPSPLKPQQQYTQSVAKNTPAVTPQPSSNGATSPVLPDSGKKYAQSLVQPSPEPTKPVTEPYKAPQADSSGRDTAFQSYLDSLRPSSAESEARKAYQDFVTSRDIGLQKIEDQTIPMQFITGQQRSLANQAEIEGARLQGDIGLAETEAEQARKVAEAKYGFEEGNFVESKDTFEELNKPLSLEESQTLGVPFGTTFGEAQSLGVIPKAENKNEYFDLGEGQARYRINPETGEVEQIASRGKTYAPGTGSTSSGFNVPAGSTGTGGGNISTLAQIAKEIAPTNSKFANEQFKANALYYIDSGDDVGLSNLIRKEAVNQLPSADIKAKYLNNVTLIENLNRLENVMGQLESQGFDTNILTGTRQAIVNKVGKLGNPELVDLTQQALNIRDLLARSRSGAALTESEEKLYKKMIPSIFRTEKLNSQIAKNLRESLQQSIDSTTGFSLSQQQQSALVGQGSEDDEYNSYLQSIGQ